MSIIVVVLIVNLHFPIAFTALYLSSISVAAQAGGGELLSKKWTDGGGVESWQKCAGTLYPIRSRVT